MEPTSQILTTYGLTEDPLLILAVCVAEFPCIGIVSNNQAKMVFIDGVDGNSTKVKGADWCSIEIPELQITGSR